MKITIPRLLSLLALLLVFSACQKSEDISLDNFNNQLSAEEFIDKFVDQKIVFQYGELNEEGKLEEGWVIDRDGKVKSFSFEVAGWGNAGHDCSMSDMEKLEDALQEELGTVSLDELVTNYKRISAASLSNPTYEANRDAAAQAFYAYSMVTPSDQHTTGGSCNYDQGGRGEFLSPYYVQVLLRKEGTTTVNNDSEHAQEIMNWLGEVQLQVGR